MAMPDGKEAWKKLGLVVLPTFITQYQPLHTLKLTHRFGKRPVVQVWGHQQQLSALKPSSLHLSMPEVTATRPKQKLSKTADGHANMSADVNVVLEAGFGLSASSHHSYELEFYSKGVDIQALTNYITANERADDWYELTKDSRALLGNPTCGIITEVWYAKGYKEESGHRLALKASATMPAELAASGLPGGAGGSVDVGSMQEFSLETSDFQLFAFQFILLSWKNGKWEINGTPHKRPQPKGAAPEQPSQWLFDEAPTAEAVIDA